MPATENRHILLIDDNESIHADFRKILCKVTPIAEAIDFASASIFGDPSEPTSGFVAFEIDSAFQGQEGLAMVEASLANGNRYALAFVDIRMPPGWDGVETIERIWKVDPEIQVVICTAYSDYSWSEMIRILGETDRLLILKKPFDNIEVRQLASALVAKWNSMQQANRTMQELQTMVQEQTAELDENNQLLRQEVLERKRSEVALRAAEARTSAILNTAPDGILTVSEDEKIVSLNAAAETIFGYSTAELVGQSIHQLMAVGKSEASVPALVNATQASRLLATHLPTTGRRKNGDVFPADVGLSEWQLDEQKFWTVIVRDVTEQRLLESQLIQAQKLESIGQLAAGIAHEINTPTQYVGHNTHFLKDAFAELTNLLDHLDALVNEAKQGTMPSSTVAEIENCVREADLAFLREEIPKAIDQSLDGVGRVAAIVSAIREFSHPGGLHKSFIDLNRLIENTIVVAHNEWADVADIKTELDPHLPPVACFSAELNQVLLNLIVNSAHAIEEVQRRRPGRGLITIRTRLLEKWVEIQVCDTGAGIAPENYDKLFDPFFTTKEVGRGTGQGLPISRTIIVKKHLGEISFESAIDRGTTFTVRLPLTQIDSECESTVNKT